MKKRYRYPILLLILVLFSSLCGCYDAAEVDDEIYVLSVGLDKGTENRLSLTIQYPTYKSGGGGGGGSQGGEKKEMGGASNTGEGYNVHTVEAPSILEGIEILEMEIARRVSLMHAKQIIFSEEMAREGAANYLAPMAKYRETRRNMAVVVVKGKAEDFIKENKSTIGESLSKSIELKWAQARNTSYFPYTQFHDFYRDILSPYESATAIYGGTSKYKKPTAEKDSKEPGLVTLEGFTPGEIPRTGVSEIEFAGTAVFNGDKMVGYLDSYETRYYLMVMGEYRRGIITLEDRQKPRYAIPVDLRLGRKPQIKSRLVNGIPEITVKLMVEGDLGAIQSRVNYEKLDLLDDLNRQIEETLKKGINKVIEKTQKELKADIFGFGHKVAGHFSTIPEWEKYNWLSHYPEAKVNVNVEVNIRRTGVTVYSAPIMSASGKKE